MKAKKLFFLTSFSFLFFLGIFFYIQFQTPPQPVKNLSTQTLPPNAYKKIRDELVAITLKDTPRQALTRLQEKIKTDKALAKSCHALTHEIGQQAYKKYKDFGKAMQYQNEICNSGYLHGTIESNFVEAKNIFASMQTICHDYLPTSFIGWECFHGVGHGLMYFTENDLPKSLSLCEDYKNTDARSACINGVFMENFNANQKLHLSVYLKPDDPFYPCPKQTEDNKPNCYLYAPTYFLTLHQNHYEQAFDWCKTAEEKYQSICIVGVGSQMIKDNINETKKVESNCQFAKRDERFCIVGMVEFYINHFGRLKEANELCKTMERKNQSTCKQVIASRESMFAN